MNKATKNEWEEKWVVPSSVQNGKHFSIVIQNTKSTFLQRAWRLFSNPFTYLIQGKIRY